ncbi:MAG: PAS domain-containing protein, partial [bacterium]
MTDEQFRRFAAGLSHVIWRLSSDGKRLIAPRWAEITGKKEHELQNDGWLETIHAEDRGKVHAAMRDAVVYGSHFQSDYRVRLRDGSYHWFHGRGEPVRGYRNELTGWIGVSSNIDDQRRAETALLEREAYLRMVIDAARVGTIDHDVVTGQVQASPMTLRLIGLPLGTNLTFDMVKQRVHPDDRAAFGTAAERAMAPDGNGEVEMVFRSQRPDGSIVWINAHGTYVFEGEGDTRRAVRFVGVAADVTGHMRGHALECRRRANLWLSRRG